MDTAWIQVFVLTIAECVAPAGKTICQEQQFNLEFLTRADCEVALEQLITLKQQSTTVIVDRSKSRCAPSARESEVFTSLEDAASDVQGAEIWLAPDEGEATVAKAPSKDLHDARLAQLPSCEDSRGEAPCKMGGIIIESAIQGDSVEIWRRDP